MTNSGGSPPPALTDETTELPVSRLNLDKWLKAQRKKGPLAIVLDSSVNGLSFARSLGRRRIPVLMLDSHRFLGAYTRYAKYIRLPPADEQPQDWLEFLEYVGARLDAPGFLFPTSDVSCQLLARNRVSLRRHFRFVLADEEAISQILNKRLQYETARRIGISIPETYYPESVADVRRLSSDIPYPCILKPFHSDSTRKQMSGNKVIMVHSASELISAYQRVANSSIPFMLQEIIPGGDSALFGYLGFWDDEMRERAWLTKRKLRQYPQQFGDGSVQMTVEAPEVAELSARLLRAFNYRGFVCVEFKWDKHTQAFRLIECNPRTASGNQLAISAGVDFPWLGYQYLRGDDIEGEEGSARPGVKYCNEEWDVQAYFALRKSGDLSFFGWLGSIRGAEAWALGALDDPLPLLMGMWRFMLTIPHTIMKILSAPFKKQSRIR